VSDFELPPISFASRGFVRHDGSVFGWSLLDAEHRDYHREHGTTDADFGTRWRQWSQGGPIDFEERPVDPAWEPAVLAWIDANYDEIVRMPRV
jgi:hypothetical protein